MTDWFRNVQWPWQSGTTAAELQRQLQQARQQASVPVVWLIGKTQSGKTSIVRFLTGAEDAQIGEGFRPCTRFSRRYRFPTEEAPLLEFLDTRGLGEPGYDPSEDLRQFADLAHIVIATVRLTDLGQADLLAIVRSLRRMAPSRPIVLALTCLHEACPRQPHPLPYPFGQDPKQPDRFVDPGAVPAALLDCLRHQCHQFADCVDAIVPIDLTPPSEGFEPADYGGEHLKQTLLALLPSAYRQTWVTLDAATRQLQDLHLRHALPIIMGYSYLAAGAGALPIPLIDVVLVPGIQAKMVADLARLYGQPLTVERFREVAASLGLGLIGRQAIRSLTKWIPFVGSVAAGAIAAAATYALGRAFCYYYQRVCQGHIPQADDLKRFYAEQLAQAEQWWSQQNQPSPPSQPNSSNQPNSSSQRNPESNSQSG